MVTFRRSTLRLNSPPPRETDRPNPQASLTRGTKITLHLKDGAEEFASDAKITSLVQTYSEFISFPIEVFATKSVPKEVEDAEKTAEAMEAYNKKKIEAEAKGEAFEEEAPEAVMKTEYEDVQEWTVANNDKPIWVKSPKDVEKESYDTFFKTTFKEFLVRPLPIRTRSRVARRFIEDPDFSLREFLFTRDPRYPFNVCLTDTTFD